MTSMSREKEARAGELEPDPSAPVSTESLDEEISSSDKPDSKFCSSKKFLSSSDGDGFSKLFKSGKGAKIARHEPDHVVECVTSSKCAQDPLAFYTQVVDQKSSCKQLFEFAEVQSYEEVGGKLEKSSCSRYELSQAQNLSALGIRPTLGHTQNQTDLVSHHNLTENQVLLSSLRQEECKDGWTYDTAYFESTIVTEFNLVCEDGWRQPQTALFFFLGGIVGSIVCGPLSDCFGRKPILMASTTIMSVSSIALRFSPSWFTFCALYFFDGLGQVNTFITVFILMSEHLVGMPRMITTSMFLPCIEVVGVILLPAVNYLVKEWKWVTLSMSVPGIVALSLSWWLPESPRWLVSCGRLQEAEDIVTIAAKNNGVEAPDVIFNRDVFFKLPSQALSPVNLLKNEKMRGIIVMLWIIWFCIYVCYFGLAFNMTALPTSPYLSQIMLAIIEIPAYFASWIATQYFPRRTSFCVFAVLGVITMLFMKLTLNAHPLVSVFVAMVARFGILASTSLLYVFTGELFPTIIRNTALSSCALFSRVGCCVAPYLEGLSVIGDYVPWAVIGGLCFLCIVICVFLPETFKKPLYDTIEEMKFSLRLPCIRSADVEDAKVLEEPVVPEEEQSTRL
ncbi:solute carrier family 22 member 4-like [Pholidichthys leucotaenia]